MRIGIAFGCFIPLHTGHMSLIDMALKENDRVVIGVCGYRADRGRDFIPFADRIALITRKYSSDRVTVVAIDDEKLGLDGTFTLSNWERWGGELFANAGLDPFSKADRYTWYTGEPSYREKLGKIYEGHEFRLIDRTVNTISGTQVRENPSAHAGDIAPEFLEYLTKKGLTA